MLIGFGVVTTVALIAGVRSAHIINKALVLVFWAVYAAFALGVSA